MSGSLGDQNRRGTGGDSRPNKKRKFDLDSDERQRHRACDAYKLLENIQDVKNRGGPAFPPATEGQFHHVQAGFAQLNTHQDGFNLDGPTGQVNWIGAVSHVNNATWGSRVALNNPDALTALCTTMQAIGARENATAKVAAAATAPQSTAAGYESSRRVICANCRHPGHKAALCPKPDAEFGAMFTCMVCNDARHHLDNCPDFAPNKEIFPRGFHGKSQQGGGQTKPQSIPSIYVPGGLQSDPRSSSIWIGSTWRKPTGSSLTKFLEKPAKFYLPWPNSFSIQLAKAPYNSWEKGIKAAPTKAKEWVKDGLLPCDDAWEGLTLSQVLDRRAKRQLEHLQFVSPGSKGRIPSKAAEEITQFALRQLVQWGLLWPPACGEMAGFIVLPSEILEARKISTMVPVKRDQDEDGIRLHSVPFTTPGGVVVAGSGDMSQAITTLNHGDGEEWGLGPLQRDEMQQRWNLLMSKVHKGIIKYRMGLIQYPFTYDSTDEFETYLMKLLEERLQRDATRAKVPVELPRNLLASFNEEVVEVDINAIIRSGRPYTRG